MAVSKITNASIGEAISVSNMPTGSVIQTVSASLGNDNVTTSTSYVDTGLTDKWRSNSPSGIMWQQGIASSQIGGIVPIDS